MQGTPTTVEPWLRGTHTELHPILRASVHALEAASEDVQRWCGDLSREQLVAAANGLTPLAYHLRHLAGSVDRLLTYAEGRQLSDEQLASLEQESEPDSTPANLVQVVRSDLNAAIVRIRAVDPETLEQPRAVGRKQLPTTVAGLLIHVAEHTQRHVGQIVITAKAVRAMTPDEAIGK